MPIENDMQRAREAIVAIAEMMAAKSEQNRDEQPEAWEAQYVEMRDNLVMVALRDPAVQAAASLGIAGRMDASMRLFAESTPMMVVVLLVQTAHLRKALDAAREDARVAREDLAAERALLDDTIGPEALRMRAVKW